MADNNQLPINVNIGIPAVASDGSTVTIDDNGNVSLIFFQATTRNEKEVTGMAVGHFRLNLDQLKELRDIISSTITTHEQRAAQAKK